MFCIPANYSKFNPPLNPPGEPPAEVQIGLDNFEILKIDDREFTIEINAYFIVKWRDKRIEVGSGIVLVVRGGWFFSLHSVIRELLKFIQTSIHL